MLLVYESKHVVRHASSSRTSAIRCKSRAMLLLLLGQGQTVKGKMLLALYMNAIGSSCGRVLCFQGIQSLEGACFDDRKRSTLRVLPFFLELLWFRRQPETSASNIPAETDAYNNINVDLDMMPITF